MGTPQENMAVSHQHWQVGSQEGKFKVWDTSFISGLIHRHVAQSKHPLGFCVSFIPQFQHNEWLLPTNPRRDFCDLRPLDLQGCTPVIKAGFGGKVYPSHPQPCSLLIHLGEEFTLARQSCLEEGKLCWASGQFDLIHLLSVPTFFICKMELLIHCVLGKCREKKYFLECYRIQYIVDIYKGTEIMVKVTYLEQQRL